MIGFLKKLLKRSGKSALKPEPTASISEYETVSRFLTSKSQFAKSKSIVKYGAFLPNRKGETSVYRTTGISDNEIWLIGEKFVRAPRADKGDSSCTLYGRGNIEVKQLLDTGLKLVVKPIPHPRHADISNWPEGKETRQMIATKLANKATFHLHPDQSNYL